MKTLAILFTFLWLSGCAVFTSRETFVACRVADVATTRWVIMHGGYEAGLFPFPIVVVLSALVSVYAWQTWDQMDTAGKAIANGLSCLPVTNNINVIHTIRETQ